MAKAKNSKAAKTNGDGAKPALDFRWVDPAELDANPSNWRRHPPEQMAALEAQMKRVGWAGVLLFNTRTNRLVDGHGRKELWQSKYPGQPVPVLFGDWSEEQEKEILLTLDPIAAMATPDPEQLRRLIGDVNFDDPALQNLTEGLEEALADLALDGEGNGEPKSPSRKQGGGNGGGDGIAERYEVVIECGSEAEQREVFERFKGEGMKCRALTVIGRFNEDRSHS